jgi:tetratricopeptide (TPR) repeat protein
MPLTLPFLLLLLDWWPLARWSPTPGAPPHAEAPALRLLPPVRLWIEKLPLFLLAAASAAVTLVAQARGGSVVTQEELSLPVRLSNALLSCLRYLGKTCWPDRLAVFYPHPETVGPWWAWAGALLAVVAATALALHLARSRPWAPVGWFWYLGSLVPVIGLLQVGEQAMADRYTYLTLTGIFLAATWSLERAVAARPRLRLAAAAFAAALVVACAALSARQVGLWRDDRALFAHAAAVTERNWVALSALGDASTGAGDPGGALAYYRRALLLRPMNPSLLNNVGNALAALGRDTEAETLFRQAILVRPASPVAHYNLAKILHARGRLEEAERHYRETLRLNDLFVPAHTNLGLVLAARGRFPEAAVEFRRALALDPGVGEGHYNLGLALALGGDDAAAAGEFRLALTRRPDDAEARARLDETLARLRSAAAGGRSAR